MFSNKTFKIILALMVAAIMPLSLYFIMRQMHDGHIDMPKRYRMESVQAFEKDGKQYNDTIYHTISDLALTNQLGKKIRLNSDLQGKVLVIDFMFTTCTTVCPQLSSNMAALQKAWKKKKPDWVQFISITVDPSRDSVTALRTYADQFGADHDRWYFLTGDQQTIFDFAKNELGVVLQPEDGGSGVVHSENIILIDPKRHIRGYYNGTDARSVAQLANDIAILQMEKEKKPIKR